MSGPCALFRERTPTPFHSLGRSIAYQQLGGKAAGTIFGRVLEKCGKRGVLHPGLVSAASDTTLRAAGLSRSKVLSLKDLASHVEAKEIPSWAGLERLDDEEIIERLTAVRGIGVWTVQMLLMFDLHRLDVLPVGDYGVRNGFAIAYRKGNLPSPKELSSHAEIWRPYRSVASWYMWRAVELGKSGKLSLRK